MMRGEGFKDNVHAQNYILKRDLDLLIDICRQALEQTNIKVKETRKEIEKIGERLGNERRLYLTEEEQNSYELFTNLAFHFDYLILHALFISAFSIFEDHLLRVAKQLETYSTYRIKIKDISNDKSELNRIRKYLNLVHDLKFAAPDNQTWNSLFKFQQIRNLIIHNGNRFKNDNPQLKQTQVEFLEKYKAHMPRDLRFQIKDERFLSDFKTVALLYSDSLAEEIYKMQV